MSGIEINQVMAQMRVMQAKAQGVEPAQPQQADFAALLKQSVDQVNGIQKTAGGLAKAYDGGDPNVNLADVMVSLQKASIAFESVVQVRNKLIEAYREVKNIQV